MLRQITATVLLFAAAAQGYSVCNSYPGQAYMGPSINTMLLPGSFSKLTQCQAECINKNQFSYKCQFGTWLPQHGICILRYSSAIAPPLANITDFSPGANPAYSITAWVKSTGVTHQDTAIKCGREGGNEYYKKEAMGPCQTRCMNDADCYGVNVYQYLNGGVSQHFCSLRRTPLTGSCTFQEVGAYDFLKAAQSFEICP